MSDSPTSPDDSREARDSDTERSERTDRTDRTNRTDTDRISQTDRTDRTGSNRVDRSETDTEMREGNRDNRPRNRSDTMKYLSGIVSLIGLWIAASPFVYGATQTAMWNNIAVGAVIFLVAGYNYYRMTNEGRTNVGAPSLVALLGLWSIVAPFMLAFGSDSLVWSTLASGLIVAALSGYNAYRSREMKTTTTTGARA